LNRPSLRRLAAAALLVSIALAGVAPGTAAESQVLDLEEAAALLRVTPDAVRALAEAERIPARRVGDTWRFSRAALLEWLKGKEPGSVPATPAAPGAAQRAELASRELSTINARGEAPPLLAQAAPAAKAGSPPPTVGERPATPTAEEIALRDQRVLLRRGTATIDFGMAYAHSEQAPFPGAREEQRSLGAVAALRYGLLNNVQITVRLPRVWRRTSTFVGAPFATASSSDTTRDSFTGDVSVSLLGVALREAAGRPNIILSLDYVAPTGPGDRGVGGGLVLSKSYDPAVIFAGMSYLKRLDAADSRGALAEHNVGLNLGYTYALNDSLALSTVFSGTYRNAASSDGVSIPPPRERYQVQIGMTWMIARRFFAEPSVAMRLGGETSDLVLALNFTYSF
jgi:excisionase family DNA binding protein